MLLEASEERMTVAAKGLLLQICSPTKHVGTSQKTFQNLACACQTTKLTGDGGRHLGYTEGLQLKWVSRPFPPLHRPLQPPPPVQPTPSSSKELERAGT